MNNSGIPIPLIQLKAFLTDDRQIRVYTIYMK